MDPLEIFPNAAEVASGALQRESSVSPGRLVLTVAEAAERLGIGQTLMSALVRSGEVESVRIGRLRRIPGECLEEYIERLRRDSQHGHPAA